MILKFRLIVFCSILITNALLSPAQTPAGGDKTTGSIAADPAAADSRRQDEKYRIGYRDKLSVQVFNRPELSQTVSVNPDGTIVLFKLPAPVVAVCKTDRQLSDDIAAAYKKDYLKNPEVNVVVTEQMSQSLAVMGAVEKPGIFPVARRVHLLELLAFAGGPSKEAGSRLVVARTGSTSDCSQSTSAEDEKLGVFYFTMRDLLEGKQTFMMQPGDMVSVLEADIVFVYGNVNEQGQVVMKQPMTLTQAIASAHGYKSATAKDKVRIIRQKPGSLERVETVHDLNAISKQKAEDPYLLPNDIVAVSQDKTKSIINSVAKSFTQGLGGLLYRPL